MAVLIEGRHSSLKAPISHIQFAFAKERYAKAFSFKRADVFCIGTVHDIGITLSEIGDFLATNRKNLFHRIQTLPTFASNN